SRLSWRILRRQFISNDTTKKIPTLVVGAGSGGSLLIRQMLTTPYMGMEPVTVVDDDINKQNMSLTAGVKVQGKINDIPQLIKTYGIKTVIIAIPTISQKRFNEINTLVEST